MRIKTDEAEGEFVIFDDADPRPEHWDPPSMGYYVEQGHSWPIYATELFDINANVRNVPGRMDLVVAFDPPNESRWPSWTENIT